MMIRDVNYVRNKYCGPAALSALTGLPTWKAGRCIAAISGQKTVKSVYSFHLVKAIAAAGFTIKRVKHWDRETLGHFIDDTEYARKPGTAYLVLSGRHYQLIEADRYVCSVSERVVRVDDPVVRRRTRIAEVHEVTGSPTKVDALDGLRRANEAKRKRNSADRRRVRALYAAGIIDFDDWDYKEEPPRIIYPGDALGEFDDPYEGDHTCCGWDQAREMMNRYEAVAMNRVRVATKAEEEIHDVV